MAVRVDSEDLKHGVLGLVVALVEIIRDALKHQALRRMEAGTLSEVEADRLGEALASLEDAIERIKEEQGIAQSVRTIRDGLDDVVDDLIDRMINPGRWVEDGR